MLEILTQLIAILCALPGAIRCALTIYDWYHKELREARKTRQLTAEEMAERVNVDTRTYLSWERGERMPRAFNRLVLERELPELRGFTDK